MTNKESDLLNRMQCGEFDGVVAGRWYPGESTCWRVIENGTPVEYKKGPGYKFFNGKENERIEGALHTLRTWDSDSEKLEFLQKYGWLTDNADIQAYSAEFK